jgi:hypothetical protein
VTPFLRESHGLVIDAKSHYSSVNLYNARNGGDFAQNGVYPSSENADITLWIGFALG